MRMATLSDKSLSPSPPAICNSIFSNRNHNNNSFFRDPVKLTRSRRYQQDVAKHTFDQVMSKKFINTEL